MKKIHLIPIVVAGLFGATASLYSATSGVVGAVNFDIATGPTVVSFPFLKPVEFQGAVVSVAGADVELPATIPALAGASYIHVLDGTDAGMVYDISSVAGAVATLSEAPLSLANGDTVAIRQHLTLADLGTPPLFASATFLDAGVPVVDNYTFLGWSNPGRVIYPGEGIVIGNSTVWNITLYGSVSENDVIFSAGPGSNIVGNIDPVNGSADVLATSIAGLPLFASITELVSGVPTIYNKTFAGWTPDPSVVDVSNFQSFVINTSSGVDIVNAGIVVGP